MSFKKGQIITIPITFENGDTVSRLFLVQSAHTVLPIIGGYNITAVGENDYRKKQYITNVPLVHTPENGLAKSSVVKMDKEYILDNRKARRTLGQLSAVEQQIIDNYEKIYRAHGLQKAAGLENLDEKLNKDYTLFNAIADNNAEKVSEILNKDESYILENQFDTTILHWAVQHQALETASTILDRGHDPNALNAKLMTPLFDAVCYENLPMADLLLEHGADPELHVRGKQIQDYSASSKMDELIYNHMQERQRGLGQTRGPKR